MQASETEPTEPTEPTAAAEPAPLATILPRHVHQDMGDGQVFFSEDEALAVLLARNVAWITAMPDGAEGVAGDVLTIGVNCSDVFAWGCSETERLPLDEVENLYGHWTRDPKLGTDVWCIVRRREMPQRPVEEAIRKAGLWDLDALKAEHGLRANHYDGVNGVLARRKHAAYSAWAAALGKDVRPYDAKWWAGWDEYAAAHPGWHDAAWKAEDDRLVEAFRRENGYA